ncbi:MAG: phosphatidylglycerophosphatase A [Candidatus Omnitrophica bacterium]|nr:phosphatidylglycerophosphatase A [Candidatus Omnitrophota bacterium]
MLKPIAYAIATCGPLGRMKFAPGTFGTLVGIPLVLIASFSIKIFLSVFVVLLALSIWSARIVSLDLKNEDPSMVVIDEVCGMFVSLAFVPLSWQSILIAFLGFRFFDIAKPKPLPWLERLPHGFGIVFDDLGAGIYTNLILQVLVRYVHV